jgi:hypothetical protein
MEYRVYKRAGKFLHIGLFLYFCIILVNNNNNINNNNNTNNNNNDNKIVDAKK